MVADEKPSYYYQSPLTIDAFKFQIDWLKKNGFEFVSLEDMYDNAKNKKQVAITTDDGFVENYTILAPLLKEYGITATFFMLNNCIDNQDLMWRNKLAAVEHLIGQEAVHLQVYDLLKRKNPLKKSSMKVKSSYQFIPMREKDAIANEIWKANYPASLMEFMEIEKPYLTTKQIQELLGAGFTIGAHTCSHPKCSQLTFDELENEIVGSINQLRTKFNTTIDFFAYPFGDRPSPDMEREVFRMSRVKAFLGNKNNDKTMRGKIVWERDKMEQPKTQSLFWFSAVPLFRKYILNPVGIYK
jgi:peptidoglycan/xylan/chitin deacetylase (PgdA/CDA1 family)